MEKLKLKVLKLAHFKGELPKYETSCSSGFDIRASISKSIELKTLERILIPTGLSFEIPNGYEIQIRPRSGLALKNGISLVNTPGTIDSDYRGELKILLINLGKENFIINDQDRIAQAVLCPVIQAQFEVSETLSETLRNDGGFGSTGLNG